jgi:galactan 5-O-arabinofuranosyltransferase
VTNTLARPAARQAPPTEPPLARLSLGRTLTELVLGSVFAVVFSFALQLAANRIGVDPGTNVPIALVNLAAVVILGASFALLAFGRVRWPSWVKIGTAWGALTAITTLVLAIPLQATRFFLSGSSVDNTFRLQYLERMASSASLSDMNYHGLAPYYPGGWFWLGGRFADLIGVEGWTAYKPYAIMWTALAAVVAFVLWSLVVNRRLAVLLTLPTIFAGFVSLAIDEPYAWPTTAWLPPIAVLAWTVFRRRGRVAAWPLVLIGVYLGFSAITYTLHLVFGVLVVVVLAAVAGVLDVRRGEPLKPTVRELLLRLTGIGAITAVLALLTWGPFILAGGLGKPNVAAHFLPDTGANFPAPFEPTSVFGLLCLAGLVWLVVRARREPIAFVLLTITVLVYAWFALSTLALMVRTSLLAFRFVATVDVALAVAGVLAAVELIRALPRLIGHAKTIRQVGFVLALAGVLSLTQLSLGMMKDQIDTAESDYYANGFNAKGEHDTGQDGAWTGELITTINELSGRPPTGNIVLSAYDRLLSFEPYWGFQQTTPHYANPLAAYTQRNDEISYWASAADPGELRTRLADNPHEAPNVFVFRKDGDQLLMPIASDVFPRSNPLHVDEVKFDPKLFDATRFTQREVGPFVVIVAR